MKIIADENIPYVGEAFDTLGEVTTFSGREITAQKIADADILLVRSVTKIGAELLKNSQIKFVATATIGLDHVDVEFLKKEGIGFASAPGCNANSVAEYVLSALCVLAERQGFKLHEKTVGIIGCGNVGSKLLSKLQTLDVHCLVNDPPLKEQTDEQKFVKLDEALSADIITLHVPLEFHGKYPTYHMVNHTFLSQMQKGAILINTSRGAVVDEAALTAALNEGRITAVLDVWENEPAMNTELLPKVELATPHIAGYSFDGKVNGTRIIYQAACDYFQICPTWSPPKNSVNASTKQLTFSNSIDEVRVIRTAILSSYNIQKDDFALRQILKIPVAKRSDYFDALRKNYPIRREFPCTEIRIPAHKIEFAHKLSALGFRVKQL